jgi:acylglycerol lipase
MAASTTIIKRAADPDLFVRAWSPPGDPWASVLIVHGLAEHSGRWEHVGERLATAGLAVQAFDQRGFGKSGGRRAYVDRFSDYHVDLEQRLVAVRAAAEGKPVVLFGHSLGGLIALGYVLGERPLPDFLVLSAPAIEATVPAWKRGLARVLSPMTPTREVANELDGEWLSADPEVGRRYVSDPVSYHRSTIRLAAEGFAEQGRVLARLNRLSIPTLVYHGEADPIVPCASSERLAGLAGVNRHTYPGLRHETHNEPGSSVIADVVRWLEARIQRSGEVPV